MEIVNVIVAILMVYFMYQQNNILAETNRIMQSQTSGQKSKETPAVKTWRMSLRRYWPMAGMAILAVLTWLPLFIPSIPQGFRLPSYNKQLTVSISSTSTPGTLDEIVGKTFEDADVPIDGHAFKNCIFINCCLLYDGGAYVLENTKFRKHWSVCVKNDDLKNFQSLATALGACRQTKERTVVRPNSTQAVPRQIHGGGLAQVGQDADNVMQWPPQVLRLTKCGQ